MLQVYCSYTLLQLRGMGFVRTAHALYAFWESFPEACRQVRRARAVDIQHFLAADPARQPWVDRVLRLELPLLPICRSWICVPMRGTFHAASTSLADVDAIPLCRLQWRNDQVLRLESARTDSLSEVRSWDRRFCDT